MQLSQFLINVWNQPQNYLYLVFKFCVAILQWFEQRNAIWKHKTLLAIWKNFLYHRNVGNTASRMGLVKPACLFPAICRWYLVRVLILYITILCNRVVSLKSSSLVSSNTPPCYNTDLLKMPRIHLHLCAFFA